jgi:purine-nucleoside/S-methyl-5'-thioadenosine phosphorylase / adenosine deaminase
MKLFEWEAPGPYRVAFSTRLGGVSEGPYASLNLGAKTDDDYDRVSENRRRLCAETGADATTAMMGYQVHGSNVTEAKPKGVLAPTEFEQCDGLWSDRPGQAMLLVTADCAPVALCRSEGDPKLALLHVGWKGLLDGIVQSGASALEGGELTAAVGPAIGPCCYEVGEEVAAPYRERFGADVMRGRNLDLPLAVERALEEAGIDSVEHTDICTACHPELFFSHRRDNGVTGRQGVIGYVA